MKRAEYGSAGLVGKEQTVGGRPAKVQEAVAMRRTAKEALGWNVAPGFNGLMYRN